MASLKEILRCSGGRRRCKEIDLNEPLASAIRKTSFWFTGRKALFICDDLWRTSSCETGYLYELMGLLDSSPESHMVFSTRSNVIAPKMSSIVFKPRSSTGREARGMFLVAAGFDENARFGSACEEPVRQALELCGGVPLMLSIAGAYVRRGTDTAETFTEGPDMFSQK